MLGMLEGASFIVLLGIAMPLKHLWGYPLAVRIVGLVHGLLFMTFCAALVNVRNVAGWGAGRTGLVLLAALLPFGPFVIDGRLKREDEARRLPGADALHRDREVASPD